MPEACIPKLSGLVRAGRQDPSTVRTKRRMIETILMRKGGDRLARDQHPRAWRFCPSLPSGSDAPFGLNAAIFGTIPMVKGGDELAGGRIPKLGGFVRARRQDPSAVRTKRRMPDQS